MFVLFSSKTPSHTHKMVRSTCKVVRGKKVCSTRRSKPSNFDILGIWSVVIGIISFIIFISVEHKVLSNISLVVFALGVLYFLIKIIFYD